MNGTSKFVREMNVAEQMVRDAIIDTSERNVRAARSAVHNASFTDAERKTLYRLLDAAEKGANS